MKSRHHILGLLCFAIALLIGVSGCGLSDYEKRMDAQRQRVQKFDEFNQLLDDPIETPLKPILATKPKDPPKDAAKDAPKDEPAWLTETFLRLPKGYSTKPKEKEAYYGQLLPPHIPFPFFRYASAEQGHSIFVAVALIAEEKDKEKEKTVEEYDKYTRTNFRFLVKRAIQDFHAKKNPKAIFVLEDPEAKKLEPKRFEVDVFSADSKVAEKIRFHYFEYTDANVKQLEQPKSTFRAYFHEDAGKQICIVEQHPALEANEKNDTNEKYKKNKKFEKDFEAALSTLDLSSDAAAKRAQFKKR